METDGCGSGSPSSKPKENSVTALVRETTTPKTSSRSNSRLQNFTNVNYSPGTKRQKLHPTQERIMEKFFHETTGQNSGAETKTRNLEMTVTHTETRGDINFDTNFIRRSNGRPN